MLENNMPLTPASRTFLWQLLAVVFVLWSFALPRTALASPLPVTGYAWSDHTGWISFSGTASNGALYGVSEDSATGALSGYAWSDNLGWITFNSAEVSGCPSGTCAPAVNLSRGNVTGWARACSAFAGKSLCSGTLDGNSGGWDGWIALSAGNGYGVTQNLATCTWSGYAWGSDAVGTISMSGLSPAYGVGCTSPDLSTGSVSPTSATVGVAITLSATISNTGTGSTGAGFTNLFQSATAPDGTGATDIGTSVQSTALSAGATATASLLYTFASPGTFYLRACADKSSTGNTGTIAESNETNNCGAWTAVTVASALSATLSANKYTIDQGKSSTLSWSSSNATSCGAAGGGIWLPAGSPTSGSVSVSPSDTSSYQVRCTKGSDYADSNIVTIQVVLATASISAVPTCISGNGSSKLSWNASQVSSCSVKKTLPLPETLISNQITGSQPVTVSAKSTYTISCTTNGGGTITKSVIVDVSRCWTEF